MLDLTPRIWQVGALCRAVADALDARFNPVAVRGEVSGFSRASSGHCYFSIKDLTGQIRCVLFKRAAGMLDFVPRDGELVDLRGRLGLYEPRGDLQLIVESMGRVGAGALFEQFLRLKAKLEAEGLFDPARKRPLPSMPRAIGVVTSLGAAALHDVVSVLQRRVPHIPVVLVASAVQGSGASAELARALTALYEHQAPSVDVILLVRGGGSMEDLWAFNDEALARVIAASPVPVISGVGHETDFTIADFVADLRAPTPTAASELVAQPRDVWMGATDLLERRLGDALERRLDTQGQRIDGLSNRLGRPSARLAEQRVALLAAARRLQLGARSVLGQKARQVQGLCEAMPVQAQLGLERTSAHLAQAELRLGLLDPTLVLRRGYAWLSDRQGITVTSVRQTHSGQALQATVADGTVDLVVEARV
ncbi:MAG: exodeoxyribonuclease VII large subunit [Burkholderiaceae bacterium]